MEVFLWRNFKFPKKWIQNFFFAIWSFSIFTISPMHGHAWSMHGHAWDVTFSMDQHGIAWDLGTGSTGYGVSFRRFHFSPIKTQNCFIPRIYSVCYPTVSTRLFTFTGRTYTALCFDWYLLIFIRTCCYISVKVSFEWSEFSKSLFFWMAGFLSFQFLIRLRLSDSVSKYFESNFFAISLFINFCRALKVCFARSAVETIAAKRASWYLNNCYSISKFFEQKFFNFVNAVLSEKLRVF